MSESLTMLFGKVVGPLQGESSLEGVELQGSTSCAFSASFVAVRSYVPSNVRWRAFPANVD